MLEGVSLDADTPSFIRFSVKSSNHSGKSRNRFPSTRSMSLFSSSDHSELSNWSPSTGRGVLRRRVVARLDVESSGESCVNDVEDFFLLAVELEEPVDNPGTTIEA